VINCVNHTSFGTIADSYLLSVSKQVV